MPKGRQWRLCVDHANQQPELPTPPSLGQGMELSWGFPPWQDMILGSSGSLCPFTEISVPGPQPCLRSPSCCCL